MLTVINNGDLRMVEQIQQFDPFQLAPPFYILSPLRLLPPIAFSQGELDTMPIKLVPATAAPIRLNARGTVSRSQDWQDIINAMKTVRQDQAVVVDLNPADFVNQDAKKKGKEANGFAYALRRYFTANGLMATAYQSGAMQVTVKHATAPPPAPKKRK